MNCPICRKNIKDSATFCPQCGKMIPRCPTCKMVLTKRMQFCKEDGTKIPESILAVFPLTVESNTPERITQGSARTPISGGQGRLASALAAPTSTAESLKINNGNDRGVQVQRFCVQCGKPCATTETLCHSCKKAVVPPKSRNKHKNQKAVFLFLSVFLVVAISAFLSYLVLSNGTPAESGSQSTELMYDSHPTESTLRTTVATTITEVETTDTETSVSETTAPEATEAVTTAPEVTTQETLPVQLEFSDWSTALPAYVTEEHYIVEKQQLYSYSMLETTSSVGTNYMDGWELYASADGKGDFGPWSSWSTDKVSESENRNVESEVRYRYSDKETKSSSSSSLSGWTLYDTTYAWSAYGSWSDWSTTAVSGSDSRKVESKTQYQYRDISYSTEYTDWGSWSGWQDSPVYADNLTQVETRTVYEYGYFSCPNCGNHWHGYGFTCFAWGGGCGRSTIPESSWTTVWGTTPQSQMNWQDWHGTGHTYAYYNGERVFRNKYGDHSKPQYRYSTRSTYQEAHYGNWSSWSDSSYSSSSTREVESRTVYRYCDRSQIPTYYYYRWTDWSGWSTTPISSNSSRDVETKTFYRYQDRVDQTTYYFRRWTAWSAYSNEYVEPSDTVKVETITKFRFKSK